MFAIHFLIFENINRIYITVPCNKLILYKDIYIKGKRLHLWRFICYHTTNSVCKNLN